MVSLSNYEKISDLSIDFSDEIDDHINQTLDYLFTILSREHHQEFNFSILRKPYYLNLLKIKILFNLGKSNQEHAYKILLTSISNKILDFKEEKNLHLIPRLNSLYYHQRKPTS